MKQKHGERVLSIANADSVVDGRHQNARDGKGSAPLVKVVAPSHILAAISPPICIMRRHYRHSQDNRQAWSQW